MVYKKAYTRNSQINGPPGLHNEYSVENGKTCDRKEGKDNVRYWDDLNVLVVCYCYWQLLTTQGGGLGMIHKQPFFMFYCY
jgi:hypothetical protein